MPRHSSHPLPHRPTPRAHAARRPAAPPHRHLIDYSLIALLTALGGALIFRNVYQATEDEMLALLAPLMLFIVVASFFAGDEGKRS